jgi:hypothetical protein
MTEAMTVCPAKLLVSSSTQPSRSILVCTNKGTGSGAFFGLGAYSYFSGMSQLDKQKDLILRSKSPFGMRSRKFGITSISLALVWMGLWRALK